MTRLRHRFHRWQYTAPADPYRPIHVDPTAIRYQSRGLSREWGLGRIVGGDWERVTERIPIEEHWIVAGLYDRFVDGRAWEDTLYYRHAVDAFAGGHSQWAYDDLDHFLAVRCAYVDDLFDRIKTQGYRPNASGEHEPPHAPANRASRTRHVHRLEPLVVIGRGGELLWREGFHRLAIARILGIEHVPVNVLGRHRRWQNHRDRIATGALDQCPTGHPDLVDLPGEPSGIEDAGFAVQSSPSPTRL